MSPEKKRDFEAEWPLLARRLRHFLSRKKVLPSQQDDLIQETALRLYKMWDAVDRTRPAWALTVTIALNLLRDEYRRSVHADVVADLPELAHAYDVERAGLARVELTRVRAALAEMSPAHRAVLLAEIGHPGSGGVDAGEKMRRMRARRKLTAILERVSAVILMPVKRLTEVVQAVVAVRDPLAAGTSCLLCTMLGVGVAVSVPLTPREAHAGVSRPTHAAGADVYRDGSMHTSAQLVDATSSVSFDTDVPVAARAAARSGARAAKQRDAAKPATKASPGTRTLGGVPLPSGASDEAPSLPSLPPPPQGAVPQPDPPNVVAPEVEPPDQGRGDTAAPPIEDVASVATTATEEVSVVADN
ncbi:MAG TPA: sigma-70 family RNA polymerase sigma factor [Actinomycetota bacterium]|nr:sigma-70 family RNA polymerase sigma factor [Actinomycetota bacterium]